MTTRRSVTMAPSTSCLVSRGTLSPSSHTATRVRWPQPDTGLPWVRLGEKGYSLNIYRAVTMRMTVCARVCRRGA